MKKVQKWLMNKNKINDYRVNLVINLWDNLLMS